MVVHSLWQVSADEDTTTEGEIIHVEAKIKGRLFLSTDDICN